MITRELVTELTGSDLWYIPLRDACALNEIDTTERICAFLAQCAHESQGFRALTENLNYSPQRLLVVFPKYFTPTEAVSFAHDEERIANRVYANRMGNGDEASGDGFLFRGRGLFQITGRDTYRSAGAAMGVDLENSPEMAADPLCAALTAAWFWRTRGCNELADAGNFEGCTRRINGGLNGMQDRLAWLQKVEALA